MPKGVKGFQKKNKLGVGRPKVDEDIKLVKNMAKSKIYKIAYDSFFDLKYNVEEKAVNEKESPAVRGLAKMAINFSKTGDINIADKLCGIFGVPTKAKEIDHKSTDGTYTAFLEELSKRNAKKGA